MTASDTTVLAAGASAPDVLATKLGFKSPRGRLSALRMKALAGATGMKMTLYAGERLVFADRQVPFAAATGFPSWQDHTVASGVPVGPNEVLNLTFTNPTAGAITANWEVEIVP